MNLQKTINLQKIIIAILIIISITFSLLNYSLQLKTVELIQKNEKFNDEIEYYRSVVMDLEENLRKGESEDV